MDLVCQVYIIAARLPKTEIWGIRSQMTRAAVSIPSNIAEGRGHGSAADFARFLDNAKGSVAELDTVLEIAVRTRFLTATDIAEAVALLGEVDAMLHAMRSKLRSAKPER